MELKSKLEEYLTDRMQNPVQITRMSQLSGGACQDNYLVDLNIDGGEENGDHELVMRTDKGAALYSSLSREKEFAVVGAAYKQGVLTPRPYWLESQADILGHPFYFMERIGGKATGRYVVKDRSLNEYRKKMPQEIAEQLGKIHGITPQNASSELLEALGKPPTYESMINSMRKELVEMQEAHPALELALNWLGKNIPEANGHVLVHGDFRTGNFMISEAGLHGVLDWEFARWGDRHEDISWLCMRDWRFGKNNRPVGGFAKREEFYADYEKTTGVAVDESKVRYWEIFGNVRWGAGMAQQAERHLSGKDKGIELAAIGRRIGEMEYEAMRLIENAG